MTSTDLRLATLSGQSIDKMTDIGGGPMTGSDMGARVERGGAPALSGRDADFGDNRPNMYRGSTVSDLRNPLRNERVMGGNNEANYDNRANILPPDIQNP